MTQQEHLRHLQILKSDSQKLKKMIKSQNYNSRDVDAILQSTDRFRLPQPTTEDKTKSRRSSILLKHDAIQSYLHQSKKIRKQNNYEDGALSKQIIDLRNQNTNLQKINTRNQTEIQRLKQELTEFKLQKSKKKNKSTPYFSFNQQVNANTSNTKISQQMIPEILYDEVKLILQESKMIIELDQTRKELDLKSITYVEYHDETKTIILRIRDEKVYIYLNFSENKKFYEKFDRSLYVNWKIVNSLEGNNLFKNQFHRKHISVRFSQAITEKDNDDGSYSEYDHYDSTPHHTNPHANHHTNYHVNHHFDHHSNHYPEKQASRQDSQDDYAKNLQQSSINFIKNFPQKSKQNSAIYIQQDSIKNLQNQKIQSPPKQISQSLLNLQTALFPQDKDIKTDKNSFFNNDAIPEENSESPSDIDKRIMKNLKNGYKMIKHAKKGYKSHEKFITILDNKTGLQFKDIDSNSFKLVDFKDIIDIKKQIGEGIKKHTKNIDVQQCIVIKLKGGNVVELTSTNVSEINSFMQELNYVMKEAKFKIN